jgi:flagellar FliL protein
MAEDKIDTKTANARFDKRTLLLIAVACLGSIFIMTALITGILYASGAFESDDEILRRLNAIDGGSSEGGVAIADPDPDTPQLLEIPDSNRLDTLYHQFAQAFVSNVANSRKVMQMNLTMSTHYDQVVIDNIVKHELAVRSAILEHLSFITEEETLEVGFRQRVGDELAVVVNAELEQNEGFGGIERVLFTEFLMQ